MAMKPTNVIEWPSVKGDVVIRSFSSSRQIRRFSFDRQFKAHAHYKSLYTKRESLEKIADNAGATIVLALVDKIHIIGFGVLDYPDPDERWSELGLRMMIEVKAIEVARSWRSESIATGIMKMVMAHPQIEDRIAYMVGYSWTWDLEGTHKTAEEYRRMLVKVFEPYEFEEYPTNEPNVSLRPENLFMARVGKNISESIRKRFNWLRFGITQSAGSD
jgi:acetoin utilization protein AcuA